MTQATKETQQEIREITQQEWLEEGKALFGEDPTEWRFKCSNCGHVQTMKDFIELREAGLFTGDAQIAYFSCIGRYDSRIADGRVGELGDGRSPCDYTLGGLIQLHKTVVDQGDGKKMAVFEFDRS